MRFNLLRIPIAVLLCAAAASFAIIAIARPSIGRGRGAARISAEEPLRDYAASRRPWQEHALIGSASPDSAVAVGGDSDVRVTDPRAQVPGPEKNMYEPVIAINPLNPDNLIAFATDLSIVNRNTSTYVADRVYRSLDAGRTWTDLGFVPHPREVDSQILGADPVTVFDRDGSAYFAHLFRPANEWRYISVFRSTDGGATWGTPVEAVRPVRDTMADRCTSYDKEWLSLGRQAGELLLVYTGTTFSCAAGDLDPTGVIPLASITDIGIYLTRSTDHGQTWSAPTKVRDGYGLGAIARVAPDGSLVVAMWAPVTTTPNPCPSGFGAVLQPLDGKPVSAMVVATSKNDGVTWSYYEQSQCSYDLADDSGLKPGNFGGGNNFPAIWPDAATNGVYIAFPTINRTQNRYTILVISSKDGGATWSQPIEATPGPDDARMPALVTRNGVLYLAYVASREDDSGDTLLRRSADGGVTWSDAIKLSSMPAKFSRDPNSFEEVRDYIGMDIVGNRIAVIWTDQRNGAPTEIWSRVIDIPTPGLANISTRVAVGTGDKAGIAGFVVRGAAPKRIVVRAIGPSLASGGTPIVGRLDDPTLELRDESGALMTSNDNWRTSEEQQINQSGLAPADDREAVIVRQLAPGSYTAIVRGAGETSGIGLVEVYDIEPNSGSALVNISTRGDVQSGENALIGGFILAPSAAQKAVVRAIGPTLQSQGIAGTLADPTMTLHDANGLAIAANDNWTEQRAEIEATSLAPGNELESAIVRVLTPGAYTAVVRGKHEGNGVALVEAYNLGEP